MKRNYRFNKKDLMNYNRKICNNKVKNNRNNI